MTLLALMDYGLLIIFFLGVAGLLLVVVRSGAAEEKPAVARASVQREPGSYLLLVALFSFLALLAFIVQKERGGTNGIK